MRRSAVLALGEERKVAVGNAAPVGLRVHGLSVRRLLIGIARQPRSVEAEQTLDEPRAVEPLLRRPAP